MKLNGVVQEILIANEEFVKRDFCSFFALYSFGSVYPKIWKMEVILHSFQ